MDENKCYEATPDEICDTLLRDYRRISGEAMHWSLGIEHAIECYRKFKKGELVPKVSSESYPKHWKYLILHYNPQTEELHIDGDRDYSSSILISFMKREIRGDISPSPQGKELDDTNRDRIFKDDKLAIAVEALKEIGNIIGRPVASYMDRETIQGEFEKIRKDIFEVVKQALNLIEKAELSNRSQP